MILQDLITAVEGADGRLDNETLGRVICAVEGVAFDRSEIWCGDDGSDELNVSGGKRIIWSSDRHLAPDVSIDAAVALIERRLPGWFWSLSLGGEHPQGPYWVELYQNRSVPMLGFGIQGEPEQYGAKTAPLALCAALLRALQYPAQENRKDVS